LANKREKLHVDVPAISLYYHYDTILATTNLSASVKNELSLRIDDNPSLVKNEGEKVTLFCKFSSIKDARLREVVWYRELDDGTIPKLLTYDAVMNITQVNTKLE